MHVLFLGLFLCAACSKGTVDSGTPSSGEETPVTPAERVLAAPGNLTIQKTDEGIILSWEDLSNREEGYLVRIKPASGSLKEVFLPANTCKWADVDITPGETVYSVLSYWHTDRSPASSVTYTKYDVPEVNFIPAETSWHMAAVGCQVSADGGDAVVFGVTKSLEDGTDAVEYLYQEKLTSGKTAYLLFEDLKAGVSYSFHPWAENKEGRVYGKAIIARLKDRPEPLTVSWDEIGAGELPEGVQLKKATTDSPGHTVNMWCVIADLSKETVEVRTTLAQSLTEPGKYIRETLSREGKVIALTNGGYFASPAMSYSYVCDRGIRKASNVTQLTRSRSYTVTRGFWGLDASGKPAIGWQAGDSFYSAPLPVYDGGPVLYPEKMLPLIQDWTPYSAIGGGPVLVKDGKYCFDYLKSLSGTYLSNHELFMSDIYASGLRAPRTAVGSNAEGLFVLLVADGRGSGGSTGLTLDEVARIMTGLGCTDVLNLDGGGSSMFLTGSEGTLQNNPSDGHERKVMSFVSILER